MPYSFLPYKCEINECKQKEVAAAMLLIFNCLTFKWETIEKRIATSTIDV